MTEKQIKQIEEQLLRGEKINRAYRAVEGDIRVITRNAAGRETRYTVIFDADDNVTIRQF
ncbi:MAG: hypothetical protein PHV21_03385 [Synergistaceae bacterium]|nr:hypothetical protein [Synergistaceae bacterium]